MGRKYMRNRPVISEVLSRFRFYQNFYQSGKKYR
nr:MAG TPA: hypothetical protein [Caudoviricetes sp.]DAT94399.1 MAG TPA: hypothetical protein [Caudoviricetes sp.]